MSHYSHEEVPLLGQLGWRNELSDHAAHGGVQPCPDHHAQHLILRVINTPSLMQKEIAVSLHPSSNNGHCYVLNTLAGEYHNYLLMLDY